jgi:hypothetical protein
MFDPVALTFSNVTASAGFSGASLVPDGRVVFAPYTAANVGVLQTFTPASIQLCLSPYFNKF